jgi:hypothetical protein
MPEPQIPTTIVNHVAVDIGCPPEAAWQAILDHYVDGRKFAEYGYDITPLEGLAAFRGGYRMRLEQDGKLVDDRICTITERDERARRLSFFADYRTTGMTVAVTYQAQATDAGTRYAIDCHSTIGIDRPAGDDPAAFAATVANLTGQFDAALSAYLAGIRTTLEG